MRGLLGVQRWLVEFGFGQGFSGERLKRSDPALRRIATVFVMDTVTATIMATVTAEIAGALMTAATIKAAATASAPAIRSATATRKTRLILVEILLFRFRFRWLRSLVVFMN